MPRKPKSEVVAQGDELFYGTLQHGWAATPYPKFRGFDFKRMTFLKKFRRFDTYSRKWFPVGTWTIRQPLTKELLNIRRKK